MPSFSNTRTAVINADPATIHALINDFHKWEGWSPWEKLDPQIKRTYSGAAEGVGAQYAWEGNKKVGKGSMEITSSTPNRIELDLKFIVPFEADNKTTFTLTPAGAGTEVAWTMSGERNLLFAILGKLLFDKAIGKDFDKGLASLKELAEV
ncbi:MAG: SRPBCC family protein [Nocardiaceae bacterium]|nr:SRPBCC family protein [Nocardiaceae bacterium]